MKVMLISDQPSHQNPIPVRVPTRANQWGWPEGFLVGGGGENGKGKKRGEKYLDER